VKSPAAGVAQLLTAERFAPSTWFSTYAKPEGGMLRNPMCRCGAIWGGTRAEHCTDCHRTFSGPTTGDAHRVGKFPDGRRCLTEKEMQAKGWHLAKRGVWVGAPRGWKPKGD
jgi:hypothetical protein